VDASLTDTTSLAAVAAWHTIQAFFTNLDHLDSATKSKSFNLWTESYGGHCEWRFLLVFYLQHAKCKLQMALSSTIIFSIRTKPSQMAPSMDMN
jgi:hypothetical protein